MDVTVAPAPVLDVAVDTVADTVDVTIAASPVIDVTINAGAAAAPGPGGSDAYYDHTQGSASASWVVVHNLSKYPAVTILSSSGDEVEGDIVYDSLNQITINFSAAFSGSAYLN